MLKNGAVYKMYVVDKYFVLACRVILTLETSAKLCFDVVYVCVYSCSYVL